MDVVELTGTVNANNQIQFDEPLPFAAETRVRVRVLRETDETELARQLQIVDRVMAENENVFRELAK